MNKVGQRELESGHSGCRSVGAPEVEERKEDETSLALLVWSFHGSELIFFYDLAAAQK